MAVADVRLARGVALWSEIVKAVMGMDSGPNDDTKRGETRPPNLREKYCVWNRCVSCVFRKLLSFWHQLTHQTMQDKEQCNLPFSRMAVAHARLPTSSLCATASRIPGFQDSRIPGPLQQDHCDQRDCFLSAWLSSLSKGGQRRCFLMVLSPAKFVPYIPPPPPQKVRPNNQQSDCLISLSSNQFCNLHCLQKESISMLTNQQSKSVAPPMQPKSQLRKLSISSVVHQAKVSIFHPKAGRNMPYVRPANKTHHLCRKATRRSLVHSKRPWKSVRFHVQKPFSLAVCQTPTSFWTTSGKTVLGL